MVGIIPGIPIPGARFNGGSCGGCGGGAMMVGGARFKGGSGGGTTGGTREEVERREEVGREEVGRREGTLAEDTP